MKETIPCHSCANCAIGYETGFAGAELLHCAPMNRRVTRDDGCTMGEPGSPGTLCCDLNVDVSGHVAVWG